MGVYDSFEVKNYTCDNCGKIFTDYWQTKQFDRTLDKYKENELVQTGAVNRVKYLEFSFYTDCPDCECRFDGIGVIKDGRYIGLKEGSVVFSPKRDYI